MSWLSSIRFSFAKGRPSVPTESVQLALLLTQISNNADGGNTGRRLLDELISVVRRPGTAAAGQTGSVELGMLRQSPGDQLIARAAADVLLERAHADPAGFGAALETWRHKKQVLEYPDPPAADARSTQNEKRTTKKSAGRRVWVWTVGVIGLAVAGLITHAVDQVPSAISNLRSDLGQPVAVKVLPGPSADLVQALPKPLDLDPSEMVADLSPDGGVPFPSWLSANGAAAVGRLDIELVVTGRRSSGVRILDIQPVTTCHPAFTGTYLAYFGEGGEATTQLFYDLANPSKPPSYANADGTTEDNYFQHYTVSLSKGEQFTFILNAALQEAEYCQFYLKMTVDDGGTTAYQKIDNNGALFAVTGPCDAPSQLPLSCYRDAYVGGLVATNNQSAGWIRANPATYSMR